MGQSIYEAWDDPIQGLTAADFARWPGDRLDRDKLAPLLQGALDNGDLSLPVYLVGKCTTYDTPHGHPIKGFMIQHDVVFAVSGSPGTPWPRITTMKAKGVVNRRVVSQRLPEFNHIDVEAVPTDHGGYVDLQMSYEGSATARIGFIWSYGRGTSNEVAHDQFRAVGTAVMNCRNGLLPNGQPPSQATPPSSPTVERAVDPTVPDVDWRDPQVIRAEWETDSEAGHWGNAMSMFDEGPVMGQRLNVAEYVTRRLKFVLLGRSDLTDELTAEVCRRILVLLSQPVLDWQEEYAPRLVRLPLAIMRERRWQPPKYGGDGTVAVDLDVPPISNSVATSLAPGGDYLGYFFGTVGGTRSNQL